MTWQAFGTDARLDEEIVHVGILIDALAVKMGSENHHELCEDMGGAESRPKKWP